ncbi:hypothetical protein [Actinomadura montaniterrae]|uniref:Uncharacterized protein n=1 Tax=Actinomadura montaniterrae TaxID=1803903 RepID=A0A6L3W0D1_9ACTN|nr:hypothetical protein [Actinomadura montaniterrae]KAB2386278.1 hypothetical protein F9B16_07155 [Actinomadura montaniterrae]
MSEATGTFHLTHPRLDGPAERTIVQPWLTELTHATLNAYAEVPPALAVLEPLPAPVPVPAAPVPAVPAARRVAGRRIALAA